MEFTSVSVDALAIRPVRLPPTTNSLIQQRVYVGKEPWHGLGTPLPANGSYEEIVHAAGFYTAVERPLHSPPMEGPIPDKDAAISLLDAAGSQLSGDMLETGSATKGETGG